MKIIEIHVLFDGILIFIIGRDAVRPFIVDWPSKIYEESQIDVDVMFSFCSAVRMIYTLFRLETLESKVWIVKIDSSQAEKKYLNFDTNSYI